MSICIVALPNREKDNKLIERLQSVSTPIVRCDLIKPGIGKQSIKTEQSQENTIDEGSEFNCPNPIEITKVPLLNPELSKQSRQRNMAFLLMPFGFIAGLTFTAMTNLKTFSDLGINFLGEQITGGLVGMVSGWMGSYVGAASVRPKNIEDITSLKKLNEQGLWLLFLETPLEVELPWNLLQEVKPIEVVRLIDQ